MFSLQQLAFLARRLTGVGKALHGKGWVVILLLCLLASIEDGLGMELLASQKGSKKGKGNISTFGKENPAEAPETPETRYVKKIKAAIEERWRYLVNKRADSLDVCSIRVKLFVKKDGKVKDAEIVAGTGNQLMKDLALGAVLEAKIPPIPEDLRQQMSSDTFEMSMDFLIY